ncbi:hypothetical protein ECC02_011742 [Trypanosoma cruzi]|uniref:Uncharacterized protein n=1 Tax=Trypanosoma cruzi TaxID=5693 RepID=A0A7J6XMB5_TRYCR|nr:hypothetical protein ECC02_011742 [Trypanosoma cruzi]
MKITTHKKGKKNHALTRRSKDNNLPINNGQAPCVPWPQKKKKRRMTQGTQLTIYHTFSSQAHFIHSYIQQTHQHPTYMHTRRDIHRKRHAHGAKTKKNKQNEKSDFDFFSWMPPKTASHHEAAATPTLAMNFAASCFPSAATSSENLDDGSDTSSRGEPDSATTPWSMTMILSYAATVCRRWAMVMTVCELKAVITVCWICWSSAWSMLAVASSIRMKPLPRRSSARARHSSCRWPTL